MNRTTRALEPLNNMAVAGALLSFVERKNGTMKTKIIAANVVFIMAAMLVGCGTPSSIPIPTPTPVPTPTPTPAPTKPLVEAHLSEARMVIRGDASSETFQELPISVARTSEIYCFFKISNAPENTQVRAEWLRIKGESKLVVGEESLTTSGTYYIELHHPEMETEWFIGDYEVKLYLNGEEKATVSFALIADVKELAIDWIHGFRSALSYWVEGTVINVGTVPLVDVQLEIAFFNEDGELIRTIDTPIKPDNPVSGFETTMLPGQSAHFKVEFSQAGGLKSYRYGFYLPTGEEIPLK